MIVVACTAREVLAADNGGQKIVIPFDFESKFDQGRYGGIVGDMVWKKLTREKAFVVPETMQDVRDFCESKNLHLSPATPLEEVKKAVVDGFQAHVGIWGSIERAPGVDGEIYDLVIKCADFTTDPPQIVYECKNRTNSASEVPHLYVKQLLDKLCDRKPDEKPGIDPVAEANWARNPNLVAGNFEKVDAYGVPVGWEPKAGQDRDPLGTLVKILPEAGTPANHVARFTIPKGVAEGPGVMWYSKPFPVIEGAKYRFQCRWRTNGPAAKVFIKCYDLLPTEWHPDGSGPAHVEDRNVYRSQQNLKGDKGKWNVQTEDFTPKHTKYTPRFGRVMLYGYLHEGVVEWDDVVVKQILPPPEGTGDKEKRRSMETKVTEKEIDAANRRSETIKAKQKRPGK